MKISSTIALEASFKSATLLRGDLLTSIERSAQMGYEGVELQLRLDKGNIFDFDAIAGCCAENQIGISAYATGSLFVKDRLSLIDDDPQIREEAIRRLELYVDAAAYTGGAIILGCVRGNLKNRDTYPVMTERLAAGIDKILNAADAKKVDVVLEAINRYENNYLATAEETVAFIEKYHLSSLGILLDTFHMNIEESSMRKAFETAGSYLRHVHFADNNRLVPGRGCMDFAKIIKMLKCISYHEWVSLECCIDKDENREAREALDYLTPMLKS